MGLDYYGILELPRCATNADIKQRYRTMAIMYHAQKCDDPKARRIFCLIGEAYEVLSNLQTKAVYDQFGEEGLKIGVPVGADSDKFIINPYIYHGDPEKTFDDFFGGKNPFAEYHEADGFPCFGGIQGKGKKTKDNPINLELMLSLEELYHGCLKKMRITRRVLDDSGECTVMRDKILTIGIKPGLPEGSRIVFAEVGDQGPNIIPADVIFTVKDKPHPHFHRRGSDLIYTTQVTLGKALTGFTLDILTLDKRLLHVPILHVVNPDYRKFVPDEGMPIDGSHQKKGKLVIEFIIIFPQTLSKEQRERIKQADLV